MPTTYEAEAEAEVDAGSWDGYQARLKAFADRNGLHMIEGPRPGVATCYQRLINPKHCCDSLSCYTTYPDWLGAAIDNPVWFKSWDGRAWAVLSQADYMSDDDPLIQLYDWCDAEVFNHSLFLTTPYGQGTVGLLIEGRWPPEGPAEDPRFAAKD